MIGVDDAQPALFLIDTELGRVREEIVLEDVPKAAQIARYAPDYSLLAVSSLNSDTVSPTAAPVPTGIMPPIAPPAKFR